MRARKPLAVAVLIVSVLQHAAGADARPDGATRCRMLKLSAIAAHAHAHVRCHARAIGFGMSVVPSCLASADAKLARAFARADDAGECPPDLAVAGAASESFVAQALALTRPTPSPTPTPAPTPSPAFTGCGNGVVESGEQCDGQVFCQPTCRFVLPAVCCGQSGFCIDGEFPFLAENCFAHGVPYVLGALCATTDDACETGNLCPGSCTPEATFPATSVCCDAPSGCIEAVADDTVDLWQFFAQSCLQVSGTVGLGTCAPAGACAPGR